MAELLFLDIKDDKKCKKEVKKLYNIAFPRNEKFPFFALNFLSRNNKAKFYGIYDKDNFIGLLYSIYYKDIVYVFYFAISEGLRGKRYGSKVLESIKEKYSKYRIILMIEEIDENSNNYNERVKRKKFYLNNGFKDLNYKVKEAGVIYEMLGYNNEVTHEEYRDLMKYYFGETLYNYVYKKISK